MQEFPLFNKDFQKGQVLLITVLILIVVLTIGLSFAARTITQTKNSTEQADSERALSAAEAGVERTLASPTGIPLGSGVTLSNSANIQQVNIQQIQGTQVLLNNGNITTQDNGVDVWLSTYPTYQNPWSGTLTIYWGSTTNACNEAALEIIVLSGTVSSPTVARYAVDPCSSRSAVNHFPNTPGSGATIQGKTFTYSTAITVPSGAPGPGLIARIVPLYQNSSIAVAGSVALPAQGRIITSTGSSGSTQRKITFFQGYDELPAEFFYSLFVPK